MPFAFVAKLLPLLLLSPVVLGDLRNSSTDFSHLNTTAGGRVGVDVSNSVSLTEWKCLQTPGGQGPITFAIVRIFRSTGSVDPAAASTIKSAHASGISSVDGYLFPCVSCGDPEAQVQNSIEHLTSEGATIGRLWYDIEPFRWSSSKMSNQNFIRGLVDAGEKLNIKAGIYSNWNAWNEIVGSSWSYPAQKGLPIWYPHYDGSKTFSDFKSFGGWSGSPSIKQYLGDKSSCGIDVDYNWVAF